MSLLAALTCLLAAMLVIAWLVAWAFCSAAARADRLAADRRAALHVVPGPMPFRVLAADLDRWRADLSRDRARPRVVSIRPDRQEPA